MQTRVNAPNLTHVYAVKTCQARTPPVSNQPLRAQPGRVAMELLLLMLLCRLGSFHSADKNLDKIFLKTIVIALIFGSETRQLSVLKKCLLYNLNQPL